MSPDWAETSTSARERTLIYATGKLRPHFEDISLEHEIAHVAHHVAADGRLGDAKLHEVLSRPENRYLARKVSWICDLDCGPSLFCVPSDPTDVSLFSRSIMSRASLRHGFDTVVGALRGEVDCGGQRLARVACDQVLTLSMIDVIAALPAPAELTETHFRRDARVLAKLLLERANHFGISDEQRALTYLMLRDSKAYSSFAKHREAGERLVSIGVSAAPGSNARKQFDVGFIYEAENGAMNRDAVRVDVTLEFPFLVEGKHTERSR